jgi:hypothetical protein
MVRDVLEAGYEGSPVCSGLCSGCGTGLGFDVFPVRWVSLGVEGRAMMAAFTGGDTAQPAGPMFVTLLTIGAHVPLGE